MKTTVDLIEALLARGWQLTYHANFPREPFRWRSPDGMSGTTYVSRTLEWLPKPVADWAREHIPMAPASE